MNPQKPANPMLPDGVAAALALEQVALEALRDASLHPRGPGGCLEKAG